ncbi:MAG: ATP-binding cassette domain-containing protein [Puniceicoccales bacterium]|jgi:ATPase subunit of ABC transporter with duplicated ATPase domains|nr:ATP-binding cassette domain-containing protein [Puniceicoccales bacterium]
MPNLPSDLLTLREVEFGWPGMTSPLFQDLTVQFPSGWTGIVGANGSGKTTLLKICAGEIAPSTGAIHRQGNALYVAQRTDEPPENWEDFFWAPNAAALKSRLRISDDWSEPERWTTLSHGERKRAQIAVALWLEPALLALDEPTNHIDADARHLLTTVLRDFRGTGLLVSHDRALLDDLCDHCLLLDPPHATFRPGGVSEATAQQDSEEQASQHESDVLRSAAERLRAEAQRRRVTADQKSAAARGSHQKKSSHNDPDGRAKRQLAKMTGKDSWAGKQFGQMARRAGKLEAAHDAVPVKKRYETGIWVEDASRLARDFLLRLPAGTLPLCDATGGDAPGRVLRHPDLAIGGADHIALTGANGLGKSTLIRHILTRLSVPPERLIYVPQEVTAEESRALLDTVKRFPEAERGRVMTTISRLGSRPGRLLESAQPSPGEVRKLLLALGIVRGPHLIVMDEPTNHLDLPGILCLEEALADCPCAMLLVSHDQLFLEKIANIHWHIEEDDNGDSRLR